MTAHTDTTRSDSPAEPEGAVIVGYDGSSSSLAAVRRAVTLGAQLHRDVRVVTAWHRPYSPSGYAFTGWSQQEEARQMLETLTSTLFPQGAPATFTADAVEGMPAEVLIRESVGAEMLLVGSRGHGGFAGLLLGSISAACAENATCPVLIMRTHVSVSHEVAKPELTGVSQ
jgi:nucleotide-binding universal stress UspA family protein